ncbi:MAG: MotE family protein [Hyphomonadaceae bacterium]
MTKIAKPRQGVSVRLMPAVMVTVAAVLGLKAVAMAESVAETVAAAGQEGTAGDAAHAEEAPVAPATPQCAAPSLAEMAGLSQAEVQVLQALGARREALDARGEQIETQDALMLAAEQRMTERLAELRALETHVNELLGNLDAEQERRVLGLVDVYQRMRAKDAATVFDGLEDDVLVQVASRMRQANLAEVMGRMDPARARALTQMLADRARPPTSGGNLLDRSRGEAPAAGR